MEGFFNLKQLKQQMADSKCFSKTFESRLAFRINSLKELCGRLPEENEIFFLETKKSFTAFTFIAMIIREKKTIKSLYIATYSTNERIINALQHWQRKGAIGKVHLHMSETLQFRMPAIHQRLVDWKNQGGG